MVSSNNPARPLRTPAERVHLCRTLNAVLAWYDDFWETKFDTEWDMERCATQHGWRMLKDAGVKAQPALHSQHPASFIYILQFLVPWKTDELLETRTVICSFLEKSSLEELGPLNPITLLSRAYAHGDMVWELSDYLFNILRNGFVRTSTRRNKIKNALRLRIVYGWILLEQGRHRDLRHTLEAGACDDEDATLAIRSDAEVMRLLALSKLGEGCLEQAHDQLRFSFECVSFWHAKQSSKKL
ncbi:hypothetical protein LTR65_005298 [Meristemomyces frigidus]